MFDTISKTTYDASMRTKKQKQKPSVNSIDVRAIRRQLPGTAADGGMTREEFAVKVGVAMETIGRWERDHHKISRLAREKLEQLREGT